MTPILIFIIALLLVAIIACVRKMVALAKAAARWKECAKRNRIYYLAAVIAGDEEGMEEEEKI